MSEEVERGDDAAAERVAVEAGAGVRSAGPGAGDSGICAASSEAAPEEQSREDGEEKESLALRLLDTIRAERVQFPELAPRARFDAPVIAESNPSRIWTMADFERLLNRSLFGCDSEPSWDALRDGARRSLMGAEGVDPSAATKIWETNQALPEHLRRTSPQLRREFQMDDAQLESRTAVLPGPKVTKEQVIATVAKADYYVFPGTTQTVCCLQLVNGFTVLGSSACADPANFDEQLGKDLAYDDAIDEVWSLLGYQLRERIYRAGLALSLAAEAHSLPDLKEPTSGSGAASGGPESEYDVHTKGAPVPEKTVGEGEVGHGG